MRGSKLRNIIKKITSSGNRVKLITFIGLLAMLLIFLSEVIPKSSTGKAAAESEQSRDMSGDYVSGMEERLGKLLSEIKGVGRAEIILSVEGSEEYVYAEELETEANTKDNTQAESYKNKVLVVERSGGDEALVKKVLSPKFNGALVVCEGGYDQAVRERVIKAVSAALDLPTSKICVEIRLN